MNIKPQQLKNFLFDSDLVSKEKFKEIEKRSLEKDQKIEDLLISEKLIDQKELAKLKAYITGIPFIDLKEEKIVPEILKIIPEPIARSHNIVSFRKRGANLEVAMLDPEDLKIIDFIKKKSKLKILPRLTDEEGIKSVLVQYQKTLEAEFEELIQRETKIIIPKEQEITEKEEELEKVARGLPVIKIVDTLLKHAILQRASDIHIEPSESEIIVRYRVDGILRDAMILPKKISSGVVARIKVLANLKLDERRLPQDGRFKIESKEYKYSVRVSSLPIFDGEKIVMRLLSEKTSSISLEELGFEGENLKNIQDSIKKPVGIILITGPTGSGKTTTLYSILKILNTPEINISTIEDPVEYRMPRVNQTQVNSKIGLTFANGLRSLVRQDPDIIMVGEIRDNETASLSINAALTGHLVISTIHTIDAPGSITRLMDMDVKPFLISSTLNIVVAQRLVRKLGIEKEKYYLEEENIKNLSKYCKLERILQILKEEKIIEPKSEIKNVPFYRPIKNTSEQYKGRIGIFEILKITESIKSLIVKRADSKEIKDQAQKEGMRSMIEDGFIKAAKGLTSIEEVLRVMSE